ncbi:Flavin containing amine oxidoreductase [Geosmithia morbida]|uniref:Flavin containing amine oxidoreductase n=1 Tax=Geosmithia morbida TaxID=1094350 RepID=A0A9P5D441_9HYPO|nr:Flavin containing amine oxidoreductase [Geosmithia morbida]KAF4126918.1 Flavin containing amine oxidoreductase [Geosmithia morbida]
MTFLSASSILALCLTACAKPVQQRQQQQQSQRDVAGDSPPLLEQFDSLGNWFDGVSMINGSSSLPRRQNATIAIVGAGVSGLTTGLLLDSVGVHNWELVEASDRVGGRFRTVFVGGTDEYAEMGPMRLPYTVTYKSDNSTHEYTDHRLTFDLAEWLNELNGNDPQWKVDFIPWIQHHPNELSARGTGRHPDGRIPTRAEIAADPSLGKSPQPVESTDEYKRIKGLMNGILMNETTMRSMQRNVWRAHKRAMDEGLDDWSQQAMMRNAFHASEDVTDAIWTASDYDVFWDEMDHNSNLAQDGSDSSLGLTEWRCVDGGFNRLSDAFIPHVSDRLSLNRKVTKLESVDGHDGGSDSKKTRLTWEEGAGEDRSRTSKDYDYTIMAVPFTMTRFMDLPDFSPVLDRAISEAGLRFKSACKVSLLFSERFWERGERPIFGGKSEPDSDAVGALYYPVYGLNETGRPGLITHYRGGDWSDRFVSFTDEAHVSMVLESIVGLHGEQARDLYTGDYARLCWLQDEHTSTSWCRPDVEQHKLYIPSYHRTEHNTIFIGEHTAPTHAWISSSIHSAVRGSIQLLLELGMVDEAKVLNERWMGRWIGVE